MSSNRIFDPLLALPRGSKRILTMMVDCILAGLTVWIAYYLRLGYFVPLSGRPSMAVLLAILLMIPSFYWLQIYHLSLRRAGTEIVGPIAFACMIYGLGYVIVIAAYSFPGIPRTVGIIQPLLFAIAAISVRILFGSIIRRSVRQQAAMMDHGNILIYGAGSAGRQLAEAISANREFRIVGFIDDDKTLHHTQITGLRVYPSSRLRTLIEYHEITDIFLAIPSASRRRRLSIIEGLQNTNVMVRTLPGLMDLAHGRVELTDLRKVTIEDLLTRDPVPPTEEAGLEKIAGRTVLVTGAGGSIGSELCRQVSAAKPKTLILYENNEYALYNIHRQLATIDGVRIVPHLGSIVDAVQVKRTLEKWKPDVVFHAAAYKHVPLVERNPLAGLHNNVIGTLRLAQLANAAGVKDFVLISTDKAVRPTNIMGATKRLAELVLQALAENQTVTRFSMVRFGNVLGSSGSVVPLFREQIEAGGPITITHKDVTRYFMTIPEAVHLVLQASSMAKGGEVFVLDMGEPVHIFDLARNMIQLSGLTHRHEDHPDGDIEIAVVGLRPGEKLYEELLIGHNPEPTSHPLITKANEHYIPFDTIMPVLRDMESAVQSGDVRKSILMLHRLVAEFQPSGQTRDLIFGSKPDLETMV